MDFWPSKLQLNEIGKASSQPTPLKNPQANPNDQFTFRIPQKTLVRNLINIVKHETWWTKETVFELDELNRRVEEKTGKPFAFSCHEHFGPNQNSLHFSVKYYDPFLGGQGISSLATYVKTPIERLEQAFNEKSFHAIMRPEGLFELHESRIKQVRNQLVSLIENWDDLLTVVSAKQEQEEREHRTPADGTELFAGPSGAIQTPTVHDAGRKTDTVGCLQPFDSTNDNWLDILKKFEVVRDKQNLSWRGLETKHDVSEKTIRRWASNLNYDLKTHSFSAPSAFASALLATEKNSKKSQSTKTGK